jgi:anti-anti-sigma factor
VQYDITRTAETVVLHLRHHLAFADRRQFIDLIPQLTEGNPRCIVVDMRELRFLDSAGLGMLLVLREAADKLGSAVSLRDPMGGVRTLLKLSQFETMLPIEHS